MLLPDELCGNRIVRTYLRIALDVVTKQGPQHLRETAAAAAKRLDAVYFASKSRSIEAAKVAAHGTVQAGPAVYRTGAEPWAGYTWCERCARPRPENPHKPGHCAKCGAVFDADGEP